MRAEPDVNRVFRGQRRVRGERAIAATASSQYGVIARRQLVELGLGVDAVQHRLSKGTLIPIHRGVYAVGHSALTAHGRWLAAVLACGPGALLSHRSAAALWGLHTIAGAVAEVTVPAPRRRSRRGLLVHEADDLRVDDRTRRDGIPVTTVARTLLDLARMPPACDVERAFEEAQRLGLMNARAAGCLLERSRGRRGVRLLAALLAEDRAAVAVTRSALEARFLAVCRGAGLPRPLVNVRIAGFEVDAVWPAERLVVELDGYAFHRTRMAFERDRARDAALQLAGYRVVRVTYRMLEGEPAAVVRTVRSLLASPSHRQSS